MCDESILDVLARLDTLDYSEFGFGKIDEVVFRTSYGVNISERS